MTTTIPSARSAMEIALTVLVLHASVLLVICWCVVWLPAVISGDGGNLLLVFVILPLWMLAALVGGVASVIWLMRSRRSFRRGSTVGLAVLGLVQLAVGPLLLWFGGVTPPAVG